MKLVNRWTRNTVATVLLGCTAALAHAAPKTRIADAWYAHNAVLLMLGAADNIVATVARARAFPWMYRVAPGLARAQRVDGATMNAEALLQLNADIVFTTASDPAIVALRRTGLDVVPVSFTDFDSMLACIDLTAKTLDTPLASQRAQAYRRYLDRTVSDAAREFANVPLDQRPRVLHVASVDPLKVDGADTIVDQWIRAAGGRNAADGLTGNLKTVSIEQVLAWHPDAIVLAANAGSLDASPHRALWESLDAVRAKRVYRNPAGVFPWERYGPEVALEVRWAAQVLHPERAQHDDLVAATRDFYATFFGYPLSDADAQRILAGLPPDGSR
ncbi:ABC transporter substrate-binding protein [Paraburkholderia sp.]|uniref:ABC transporter substrate-binding protein n=1 Tax=Paraburkholderia sp. TaxID=1926495 RepID=UPI0023996599|nr:ABC transporter substrate-binding protein [Paraburkholderia sp.]MDE1180563.1 ABC transporter substrate-binding protein [Paraburkholderia sp.]